MECNNPDCVCTEEVCDAETCKNNDCQCWQEASQEKDMAIAKGPGGAYWMVQDDEGNVQSTHATKEDAEAADGGAAPAPEPEPIVEEEDEDEGGEE